MFRMAHSLGFKTTLKHELPSGAVAFVIAELFYKFHSFTLETLAFLGTWLVLSWIEKQLTGLLDGRAKSRSGDQAR